MLGFFLFLFFCSWNFCQLNLCLSMLLIFVVVVFVFSLLAVCNGCRSWKIRSCFAACLVYCNLVTSWECACRALVVNMFLVF